MTAAVSEDCRQMAAVAMGQTEGDFVSSVVIYDLDSLPVQVRPWTELENVRVYYEFFKNHQEAFEP